MLFIALLESFDTIGCCQRLARKEKDKCLVNHLSHACMKKQTLKRDDDDDDDDVAKTSYKRLFVQVQCMNKYWLAAGTDTGVNSHNSLKYLIID